MKRLKFLDFYKVLLAFFLVVFHAGNSFYPTVESTEFDYSILYPLVERASWHYFYFTGLLVAGLAFFLMGFNQRPRRWWHYLILLMGHLFVQSSTGEWEGDFLSTFDWGVFSFLVIALAWIDISLKLSRTWGWVLRVAPLLLILQPQSFYQSLGPDLGIFKTMLVGSYLGEGVYSGWFLIPWISWPLGLFCLGQIAQYFLARLQKIVWWLDLGLVLFFAWSIWQIVQLKLTYAVGSYYTQTLFSLETYQILALFGLLVPILRISLLTVVQTQFDGTWLDVSGWGWARHFWLSYIIHFGFIAIVEAVSGNHLFVLKFPYPDLIGLFIFFYSSFMARQFYQFYQPYVKRWLQRVSSLRS